MQIAMSQNMLISIRKTNTSIESSEEKKNLIIFIIYSTGQFKEASLE